MRGDDEIGYANLTWPQAILAVVIGLAIARWTIDGFCRPEMTMLDEQFHPVPFRGHMKWWPISIGAAASLVLLCLGTIGMFQLAALARRRKKL